LRFQILLSQIVRTIYNGFFLLLGGQKRRITIARTFLKNQKILILDEATSSLDPESEQLIQEAMGRLIAGRTTFIIAHRLSTVIHADQILVLSGVSIVETGTHSELLLKGGIYRDFYSRQFKSVRTSNSLLGISVC